MRFIYYNIIIVLLFFSGMATAQAPNNHGAINTSIPLFDLEYEGMRVPITLSYSQLGVQVDGLSDWTGQGWNLNTGWVDRQSLPSLDEETTGHIPDQYREGIASNFPAMNFFGGSYNVFMNSTEQYSYEQHKFTDKLGIEYYYAHNSTYPPTYNEHLELADQVKYLAPDNPDKISTRRYVHFIQNPHAGDAKIQYNYIKESPRKFIESFKIRADLDVTTLERGTLIAGTENYIRTLATMDPQCKYIEYTPQRLESISCKNWTLKFATENYRPTKRGYQLTGITLVDKNDVQVKRYAFTYIEYTADPNQKNYSYFGVDTCESTMNSPGYSVDDSKRFYLSSIQEYNSNDEPTFSWHFDYYSPEQLPERITYKQNSWGYFCDYEHLATKFLDLSSTSSFPEITYNSNYDRLPDYVDNYKYDFLDRLPESYFDVSDSLDINQKFSTARSDYLYSGNSGILCGMLKSIQYPLGSKKVFLYDTKAYGNLLETVIETDKNEKPVNEIRYSYAEGAIPLGGYNYAILRNIPESLSEDEDQYTSSTNIVQLSLFSTGSRYNVQSPAFKKVVSSTNNLGSSVRIYSTAADANADNQAPTLDNGLPHGMGTPSSMSHKRNHLLLSATLNQNGDTLSKVENDYTMVDAGVFDLIEYKLGDQVTSENHLQLASYSKGFRKYLSNLRRTTTSYEMDQSSNQYVPVYISENTLHWNSEETFSEYHQLWDNYTKTYTPTGNSRRIENSKTTLYYYNNFKTDGTELNCEFDNSYSKQPSSVFSYENGKFIGGKMALFKTTPKEIIEYRNERVGFEPVVEDFKQLSLLSITPDDMDDKILILMDKNDFTTYGYKYYCSSYKYFSGISICQMKGAGCQSTIYNRVGDSYISSPGTPPNTDMVYFFITPSQLNGVHNYIKYYYSSVISNIKTKCALANYSYHDECITAMLAAKYTFIGNSNNRNLYFNSNLPAIHPVYYSGYVHLGITRYTYRSEYETVESNRYFVCGDVAVDKVIKFSPEDCPAGGCSPFRNYYSLTTPILPNPDGSNYQVANSIDLYDSEHSDYPVQITDEKGLSTVLVYYENTNRVRYSIANATASQLSSWDESQQDIRDTLPDALVTEYVYDVLGRKIREIDANGVSTGYEYNADGKLYRTFDNDGNIVQQLEYDY